MRSGVFFHYISTRREKGVQNMIGTVTYIHAFKIRGVFFQEVRKQGELALGKNNNFLLFL